MQTWHDTNGAEGLNPLDGAAALAHAETELFLIQTVEIEPHASSDREIAVIYSDARNLAVPADMELEEHES